MGLAFEQRAKESDKAFAAFSVYLSLGPQRSLAVAAKKLGKSRRMLEKWSRRYDWPARVQAHGAHMAVVEREAAEVLVRVKGVDWVRRQTEQREEEWKVRCELLELAREALKRWKANPARCGTLEGIGKLLELASKLGRLASGMATDKTEVAGEDGGPIRVELEAAMKKIYGDLAVGDLAVGHRSAVVDVDAVPVGRLGDRTAETARGVLK